MTDDSANTTDQPLTLPSEPPSRARSVIPRRFVCAGIILGVLCGVLLFPFPMDGRIWKACFDLAHAPSFFLAVFGLAVLLDPSLIIRNTTISRVVPMTPLRLTMLSGTVAILGAACEVGQTFVGRSATIADALANSAGAISACLMLWGFGSRGLGKRVLYVGAASALLLLPAGEPLVEIREALISRNEFPLISSFERPQELQGWHSISATLSRSAEWASTGTHSLKIESSRSSNAMNADMEWPPSDWSGFEAFEMTVRNPQPFHVSLTLHVGDLLHTETGFEPTDRFRRQFSIPSESELVIRVPISEIQSAPEKRPMDLSQVAFLNVSIRKKNDLIVFLDGLKLLKAE